MSVSDRVRQRDEIMKLYFENGEELIFLIFDRSYYYNKTYVAHAAYANKKSQMVPH